MEHRKKQPNRARRGFTLAETLVTVLILLLATAIVAAGLPAAVRAYHDVVDAANAELLLSTTMTALREELGSTEGFALEDDGKTLDWYKSAGLQGRKARMTSDNTGILITLISLGDRPRELVSGAAATRRLHAEFTKIEYDTANQTFKISGLQIKQIKKDGTVLVLAEAPAEYLIRPMNPFIIGNTGS